MRIVPAKSLDYNIVLKQGDFNTTQIYPYIRDNNGDKEMWCLSPMHGRSFVVGKDDNRFVVSKGNGLSYTQYPFLNTKEMGDGTWGFLATRYAVRDFQVGNEIGDLGIKTNNNSSLKI